MLKEESCLFVLWTFEKASDRVPRKVLEWAMMKKGIPVGLVLSVMSLCKGEKTRVRVDPELSEEFEVKAGDAPGICVVIFSVCSGGRSCHRIRKGGV